MITKIHFFASVNLFKNNQTELIKTSMTSDVFRPFGRLVYWFGYPNSGPQKTVFRFSDSVVFQRKIR